MSFKFADLKFSAEPPAGFRKSHGACVAVAAYYAVDAEAVVYVGVYVSSPPGMFTACVHRVHDNLAGPLFENQTAPVLETAVNIALNRLRKEGWGCGGN